MVFFIYIISFSLIHLCTSQLHFALYNNETYLTSTFNIQTLVNQPELKATWKYFPSTTKHAFAVEGIWGLHESENYGNEGFYITLAYFGYFYETYQVGSIRYIGELGKSQLNLYSNIRFSSNETFIFNNQSILSTRFKSLILVGPTPVELYVQTNYTESSYCIPPGPPYHVREIPDMSSIGFEEDDVKSIRFGCTPEAILLEFPMDPSSILNQEKIVSKVISSDG